MELGEPEPVGVFNHHDRGIGDVQPHFDDRGRHKDVNFSRLEGMHDGGFLIRLHPSVEEPQVPRRKFLRLQAFRGQDRGFQIEVFRFLHQGIDDVGLPPLVDFFPHQLIGPVTRLMAKDPGLNGSPARRQSINDGHVEVSVDRHGQGTGDRSGRHDQDVRLLPFFSQFPALQHAEFVLFIHNDQA